MLFNSLEYAIFLPVVFALFWLLKDRYRWILILIASYYFYMSWNVRYVVLILFTTFISYLCAILTEKTSSQKMKKFYMVSAVVLSLAVLFFFKYFNFVSQTIEDFCRAISLPFHPVTLSVLLPVGISFYTFQSLSYVIDVYRGDVKAEHHFGVYAAFISFFPQLVAGPIERSANLLPQIQSPKRFDYDDAVYGLRMMMVGFFKKLIIADSVADYVDFVYNHAVAFRGIPFWIAMFFFAFQIYCDFSGYSDIALGTARLFGIRLMTNFKSPYFSRSIKEFWGRWHISLSQWFRDYVYIPLGGSRCKPSKANRNRMITFLVSGLWHGAAWTYVLWGGIHGAMQIIQDTVKRLVPANSGRIMAPHAKDPDSGDSRFIAICKTCVTFLLVCLAWNFFRANTISDAFFVLAHLTGGYGLTQSLAAMGLTLMGLAKRLIFIGVLMIYDFFSLRYDIPKEMSRLKTPLRWMIYIAIVSLIVIQKLHHGTTQEFIYFQF